MFFRVNFFSHAHIDGHTRTPRSHAGGQSSPGPPPLPRLALALRFSSAPFATKWRFLALAERMLLRSSSRSDVFARFARFSSACEHSTARVSLEEGSRRARGGFEARRACLGFALRLPVFVHRVQLLHEGTRLALLRLRHHLSGREGRRRSEEVAEGRRRSEKVGEGQREGSRKVRRWHSSPVAS